MVLPPPFFVLRLTGDGLPRGWGDTSYNGNLKLPTPSLDAMAADGLRFNRFYAAGVVCSPTRGSVVSGGTSTKPSDPHITRVHAYASAPMGLPASRIHIDLFRALDVQATYSTPPFFVNLINTEPHLVALRQPRKRLPLPTPGAPKREGGVAGRGGEEGRGQDC